VKGVATPITGATLVNRFATQLFVSVAQNASLVYSIVFIKEQFDLNLRFYFMLQSSNIISFVLSVIV
jgi:hypothetical protein